MTAFCFSTERRSSKVSVVIALFMAALALPFPISAQTNFFLKPHVAVLPVRMAGIDPAYALAGQVAGDTAFRTLNSLGRYEVERWTDDAVSDAAAFASAAERKIDDLVIGRAELDGRGRFTLEMSVWSRNEDRIVLSERQVASNVFEIFAVAERLVASLVGAFAGTHIGFGTLVLAPDAAAGAYRVYIDGALAGESVMEIERVLNGERRVEIRQARLFGERTIQSDTAMIVEDAETTLSVSIPDFLEEERAYFDKLDAVLSADWHMPSQEAAIDEAISRAAALLHTATCRTDYGKKAAAYDARHIAFSLLKEKREIAALAADAGAGRSDAFDADARLSVSASVQAAGVASAAAAEAEAAEYIDADLFQLSAAPESDLMMDAAIANAVAFRQLCLIGAVAAFSRRDAETVARFKAAVERSALLLPLQANESYNEDCDNLLAALEEVAAINPRIGFLALDGGLAFTGLAGGLFAAGIWGLGLPEQLNTKAATLNEQYLNARDSGEITRLRSELKGTVSTLSAIQIGAWAGLAIGALALPVGAILGVSELGRKQAAFNERSRRVSSSLALAARSLTDSGLGAGKRILILGLPSGMPLEDSNGVIRQTPFLIDTTDEMIVLRSTAGLNGSVEYRIDPEVAESFSVVGYKRIIGL